MLTSIAHVHPTIAHICSPVAHVYIFNNSTYMLTRIYAIHSQIIMFVKVSGFGETSGIHLPREFRTSEEDEDTSSVVLALVRWLSPHPRATLRDNESRPVCPPPLDTNHALWTYSKLRQRRPFFSLRDRLFRQQLSVFPGSDDTQRIANSNAESRAYYGMVLPETFVSYMNCTSVGMNQSDILETITLPFDT